MHWFYLHGFLSSPQSSKAQALGQWLAREHPASHYHCPLLPVYPDACATFLQQQVEQLLAQGSVGLIGSSMGGFWASWLAERYQLAAVLINPLVDWQAMKSRYLHRQVDHYYLDESYQFQEKDFDALARFDTPSILLPGHYWLLAQTGDEVLDYRLAVKKYRHCRQTIEPGGHHGFAGFERYYSAINDFFSKCQQAPLKSTNNE